MFADKARSTEVNGVMDFAPAISALPLHHQVAFSALNCEKLLPSVAKFDENEAVPVTSLFEEIVAALYKASDRQNFVVEEWMALKDSVKHYWPDLDETENEFASYAFDAFVAVEAALNLVLDAKAEHAVTCSAAVLDTVDMYVQETSETELQAAALSAFIQANPIMMREIKRQTTLLKALAAMPSINKENLAFLRTLNKKQILIDFAALPY